MKPRTAWRWGALALPMMIAGLVLGLRSRSEEQLPSKNPAGQGPSLPTPAFQETEARIAPRGEESTSSRARPDRDGLQKRLEEREQLLQKRLAGRRPAVPDEMEVARREAIERIRQAGWDPSNARRPSVELGAPLIGVEEQDPRAKSRRAPATSP